MSQTVKRLLGEKEKLLVNSKGMLFRRTVKVNHILTPSILGNLVCQELHEKMGRLGGEGAYQPAKEKFY